MFYMDMFYILKRISGIAKIVSTYKKISIFHIYQLDFKIKNIYF